MSYRQEKNGADTDIVIDGWEQGIAPSPHKGIANIQNANISTELGEVNCSFVRQNQVVQGAIAGGTLTFDSSGGNTTKLGAPSTLYGGQWINVTAATATIYDTTAPISYLVVGGGAAGGNTSATAGQAGGGGGAGEVLTNTDTLAVGAYSIVVGAGGSSSSFNSHTAVTGGAGGAGGTNNGGSGASGGGGGVSDGGGGTGGAATDGFAGGTGISGGTSGSGAGGGGGAGAAGQNGQAVGGGAFNGGAGGNGVSSSITGASVIYGGGGGGGGGRSSGGAGGTGGGGAGASAAGNGTAGTANTGGGGGGAANSASATAHTGGAGGSGIVVIRYLTTDLTATGGTITTDGSHTVHTFTTSGIFTVTAVLHEITLPTGNYYVSYKDGVPKVKISTHYDPFCDHPVSFVTSGTITFDLTTVFGKPISKATERYGTATDNQYRYYILDENGYVWVYDTGVYADSLASSGVGIEWILPDPRTYSGNANSIAILNGWLMYLDTHQISGKPTVKLGEQFEALDNVFMNNNFPNHKNFALTSKQGFMYYCDGNYIGKIAPDTSLLTGQNNIQSYCQWEVQSTHVGIVDTILSGSAPYTADASGAAVRIPAVFFTDEYGTQPTNLTVETVYYLETAVSGIAPTFSVYAALTGGSAIDISAGASGNLYFNTFYPVGSHAGAYGDATTLIYSPQRLSLPTDITQSLAEIGNLILIGCQGSVVYPWNQVDSFASSLINLPEANVQYILTVNQVAYMFAGNQGNIYITDGSLASLALNLSDYLAGVPGSPGTYIESTYTWSDSMYLRGRVYFSVLDQSATKAGNCGGVWSFVPAQNLASDQETGMALRLEAQNSYNTYNGAATLLIPNAVQNAQQPLYWSAWYSSVSAPTYGIDYSTGGTNASFPAVVETDWIPVGTMLNKKTTSQLEYKLGAPLDTGATITAKYRTQLTDTWTACDTFVTDSSKLAGYARANYQQLQWIQFQFTLTPITSSAVTNTFIRFREIRLR